MSTLMPARADARRSRTAARGTPVSRATAIARAALLGLLGATTFVSPLAAQQRPAGAAPVTLTLPEALERATGTSESVAIARAGELRARGQQVQARSLLLPQLNTSLSWQKTLQNQFQEISKRVGGNSGGGDSSLADNPLTRIFASPYTTVFGLGASQALFTGGRATATIRASNAGRDAAAIATTSARAQVQIDVTQAYFDAMLADRLVAIAESSLVQTERTLRQVQLTKQVGSASEFELVRARVTRDNQRPLYLDARTQRDLAYVRLRQLLDLPLDQPLTLVEQGIEAIDQTPVPTASPATITTVDVNVADVLAVDPRIRQAVDRMLAGVDTSVAARAPVRQAERGVEVARQQYRAVRGQRLPSVGLVTNYQRLAYPNNGLPSSLGDFFPNWTAGVQLSWPFFSGGRVRGEMLAAEAAVTEAEQRLRQVQEGAALDARQAVAQLEEAIAAWEASAGTALQASRAYAIAEVRFREGISTQLELSETRVLLQQAQANRARAARDLQVARVRLELLRDLPLGAGSSMGAAGAASGGAGAGGAAGGSGASTAGSQGMQRTGAGNNSQSGNTP